jgi:hypothetical protein
MTRVCFECERPYRVRGPKVGPFKVFEMDQKVWRGSEPFCSRKCALHYARSAYDAFRSNRSDKELLQYEGPRFADNVSEGGEDDAR